MENSESLLLELEEFNRGSDEDKQISQNLEKFIEHVAKTGTYIFPWIKIKKLYLKKLKTVLSNLNPSSTSSSNVSATNTSSESYIQQIKERIIERIKSFNSAPFTIQRISELLLKPYNHYTRPEKYLRGLEKCVMVVTTVDPNGNKIFVDPIYTNGEPESNPVRPSTPVLNESNVSTNNVEMSTETSETSVSITIESSTTTTAESTNVETILEETIKHTEKTEIVQCQEETTRITTCTTTEVITETDTKLAVETSSNSTEEESVSRTEESGEIESSSEQVGSI